MQLVLPSSVWEYSIGAQKNKGLSNVLQSVFSGALIVVVGKGK